MLTTSLRRITDMENHLEDARTKPTIETVLERINAFGDNLQGQLDVLHVNIGSVKSDLSSLKSDVGSLKSDVATLKSDVGALKSDVALLKSDVGALKSDVATLKLDVGILTSDVVALRNEFQLFRGEMEIRIDRIEGMTNKTRSEMLNLRADFREWKDGLNRSSP